MLWQFDAILIGTGQAAPSPAARIAAAGMRVATAFVGALTSKRAET